jgi:hypothetical protein
VTESEEESESDNEEIIVTELKPNSDDVNLDDEFEKIVPFKFKRLSEESLDEVDHEIEEILQEVGPLGTEVKLETESGKVFEVVKVDENEEKPVNNLETIENLLTKKALAAEKTQEKTSETDIEKTLELEKTFATKNPFETEESPKFEALEIEKALDTDNLLKTEIFSTEVSDQKYSEIKVSAIKDSSLVVKEAEKTPISDAKLLETNIDDDNSLPKDALLLKENSEDKPPVPIPTYLWEDVKKSKEQVSGDNVCTFHLFHAATYTLMFPTSFSL